MVRFGWENCPKLLCARVPFLHACACTHLPAISQNATDPYGQCTCGWILSIEMNRVRSEYPSSLNHPLQSKQSELFIASDMYNQNLMHVYSKAIPVVLNRDYSCESMCRVAALAFSASCQLSANCSDLLKRKAHLPFSLRMARTVKLLLTGLSILSLEHLGQKAFQISDYSTFQNSVLNTHTKKTVSEMTKTKTKNQLALPVSPSKSPGATQMPQQCLMWSHPTYLALCQQACKTVKRKIRGPECILLSASSCQCTKKSKEFLGEGG